MKIEKYKRPKNHAKLILLLIIVVSVVIFIGFNQVHAQSIVQSTSPDCQATGDCQLNDFVAVFKAYYTRIFGFVGATALLMFIIGGVRFMISSGNPDQVGGAKKLMVAAVIGLIIIFGSYMIVSFVLEKVGYNQSEFGAWNSTPE